MFTDFIYALGDIFTETFKVLPILGNNLNAILIIVGFVMLFYWLNEMAKHNRKAAKNGTLK